MLEKNLSTQEYEKRKKSLADTKGFVYDMPRIDVDFSDPQGEPLFSLDSEALDKKVN